MRIARVAAQAKLNLWLRVGPRDDATGYHDVDTLFHRIDLADEITVRVGGSVRALDVAGPRLPPAGLGPPDANLAYRAALAYAERAPWLHGFAIELTKHVPVGGGLGGGSADAGAVLRALDALAPTPLGDATLAHLGAALGADVAFLAGSAVAAVGSGRGERIARVEALPPRDVIIAVPDFSIATADAYRWLDEARPETAAPAPGAAPADWRDVGRRSCNDFEAAIEARYPALGELRARLRNAGAAIARLAGSGSSVFAVFEGAAPAGTRLDLGSGVVVLATRTSTQVVPVQLAE